MTIEEQLKLDDGHRFQKAVGEIIKEKGFSTIVETGTGVSSVYILKALDDAGIDGKLHSIDIGQWYPHKIEHPKFNAIVSKSIEAMLPLYQLVGPWDMFVCDGNHEILCQSYEYELSFNFLKPGGYLIVDDRTWNQNNAWQDFLLRHGLKETILGDAAYIIKPAHLSYCPAASAVKLHEEILSMAKLAEDNWIAKGGVKADVFKDT